MSEQQLDLNNELQVRREKLAAIREQGVAFPNDFRRDSISCDLHKAYDDLSKEQLAEQPITVAVAGRMMMRRIMGKAAFVSLQDVGGQIQLYITRDELPAGFYNERFKKWDLG